MKTETRIATVRDDFPLLKTSNRGQPVVYLDSGATAQKPRQVLEAMDMFYCRDYANVHRGVYELSERATKLYEETRETVRQFINAPSKDEVVFVKGTTEAFNLVAQSFGRTHFKKGDEVILSDMEHHANIVPWYMLKEQIGITLKVIPVLDDGSLDLDTYRSLFSDNTRLVSVTHASNVMGTINPVKEMTRIAHEHNVPVMLDGAQAVPHMAVDVQDIGCDFYTFSAHKIYGPTGVGVLWAKKALLDAMPPYQGGGDMIETVAFDKVTFAKVPHKFEAGTPDIGGVIGMKAAIQYLQSIGMQEVTEHEKVLLAYANKRLADVDGLKIIGTVSPKVGVISFVIDDIHPHDIGTILDNDGVAVRAGHHCAMPLMTRFNIPATVRASFGVYTQEHDIDKLVEGLQEAKRLFA